MQDNVFGVEEFDGVSGGDPIENIENRVAFIDVPLGMTVEQVQARIAGDASLYKVLSSKPILTDNHQNAINRALTTLDEVANSQMVKYPAGHVKEGQLIPDGQRPVMYRKVFFKNAVAEDQDLRGGDVYIPEALRLELEGNITVAPDQGSIV